MKKGFSSKSETIRNVPPPWYRLYRKTIRAIGRKLIPDRCFFSFLFFTVSESRKVSFSIKIRGLNDIRRFPINITKLFQKLGAGNSERQQYITRGQHDTRPGVEQSLQ